MHLTNCIDSDTVSTYQIFSVQLVTDKKFSLSNLPQQIHLYSRLIFSQNVQTLFWIASFTE